MNWIAGFALLALLLTSCNSNDPESCKKMCEPNGVAEYTWSTCKCNRTPEKK